MNPMALNQLLPQRVSKLIREQKLAWRNEHLLVGVSGGPDSVCLVHVLAGLRRNLDLKLHIVHLNHMLRGAESDADSKYVSALARKLRIPATIEARDVKAYQKKHRLSLEEAAREVRYTFFAEVALSLGSDSVAVGHTADDQIETILMRLIRGTGLAGLRGMQPLSNLRLADGSCLRVIRPLLQVRREETEAYCLAHKLSPRTDSSNLLPDRLRNRVRSQLMPLLRRYNPDIDEAVLRLASAASVDMAYIEEEIAKLRGSVVKERQEGIVIDKKGFSRLAPAIKRHLLRSAIQRLLGDLQDIEAVHIENLVEAMAKPAGKRLSLPRGLSFYTYYDHGLITTAKKSHCPLPVLEGEHRLKIPGETELYGWMVRSRILSRRPEAIREAKWRACLDLDVAGKELAVRGRRRGDRFQPLGMESSKKLQDFMVDAKIPRAWRDNVPLVCSSDRILWVAGWRIDHGARVTEETKRVLYLEFQPVKAQSRHPV
ncbi:MAG: tRNA lysidine(34) synthetase TilS [Chloroflexi bacterium]|nr:tRNA lysidine(34) synthetase TilS [Chloroflexota bacterium]